MRGEGKEQFSVDECLEIAHGAHGKRWITNEKAKFEVPIEGGLGEIGGSDEQVSIVRYDRLRVKNARWTFRIERTRIVEDGRAHRAGPVRLPESIREPTGDPVRRAVVSAVTLDVQKKGDSKVWQLVHATCEDLEGAPPIVVRIAAHPDRLLRRTEKLVMDPSCVARVDPGDLGSGPNEVRLRLARDGLLETANPCARGRSGEPHP